MDYITIRVLTDLAKMIFSFEAFMFLLTLGMLVSAVLLFIGVDKEIRRDMEFQASLRN